MFYGAKCAFEKTTPMTSFPSLTRTTHPVPPRTERILQFGEGNFLRAFVDWMIQVMNQQGVMDSGVVVVQPIEQGLVHLLNSQDGLYTLYLTGLKNGLPVREPILVDCVQRGLNPYSEFDAFLETARNPEIQFIFSNTTEAGIAFVPEDRLEDAPPGSFPAKLTRWLWERYQHPESAGNKLAVIPCELIEKNGEMLRQAILQYAAHWELPEAFAEWIGNTCSFCNTLVDRIVPGYPKDRIAEIQEELGYDDKLVVEGEHFHLWVIEAPEWVQQALPADKAGLNVLFPKDLTPYRTRKVRILNGAHTAMVPVAYLHGIETVRETVEDPLVGTFVRDLVYEEIIPTLDLPLSELEAFAGDVLDRFRNPFIKHFLVSIALNSISKFETRVLPSLLEYQKRKGELPRRIVISLAALFRFYAGELGENLIPVNDNAVWVEWFQGMWKKIRQGETTYLEFVREALSHKAMWGMDLNEVPGLAERTTDCLQEIDHGQLGELIQ